MAEDTPETLKDRTKEGPISWRSHWRLTLNWTALMGVVTAVSFFLFPPAEARHGMPLQVFLAIGLIVQPVISTALVAALRKAGTTSKAVLHLVHVVALVGYLPLFLLGAVAAIVFGGSALAAHGICSDVEVQEWRIEAAEQPCPRVLQVRLKSKSGRQLRLDYTQLYDAQGSLTAFSCGEGSTAEAKMVKTEAAGEATLVQALGAAKEPVKAIQFALCSGETTESCAWFRYGSNPRSSINGLNGCSKRLPDPAAGWPP